METHTKALQLVKNMPSDQLLIVWEAIQYGGLKGSNMVNRISTDEWITMVHTEINSIRGL